MKGNELVHLAIVIVFVLALLYWMSHSAWWAKQFQQFTTSGGRAPGSWGDFLSGQVTA